MPMFLPRRIFGETVTHALRTKEPESRFTLIRFEVLFAISNDGVIFANDAEKFVF